MKKLVIFILFALLSMHTSLLKAQNFCGGENNIIGWYATFLTKAIDEKWSVHGEFQWRRDDIVRQSQQNLFRAGLNYKIHPQVILRGGIAYIDTYPYGGVPIQSAGKVFPEYRIFQMVQVNNPLGKVNLMHRFMLEQRWVGVFKDPKSQKSDENVYLNRARYMARMDIPIKKVQNKNSPYLAAYDEILIGFGKNVNQNIFDQNRIGLLFGLKINHLIRSEIGFISQTIQFGRLINSQEFIQQNNGLIWNTYLSL